MSNEKVTPVLARFVAETRYEDLPAAAIHEARRLLLDSIGCALAGLTSEKGRLAVRLAQRLGGPPESVVWGTRGKVSATNAAFANGELINALGSAADAQKAVQQIFHDALHPSQLTLPVART